MTSMTDEQRAELVAAMSNSTQMGRLNAGEIASCFDRMVDLGYDIIKRPVAVEKPPEPPVVAEPVVPMAQPVPERVASHHRAKPKGDK